MKLFLQCTYPLIDLNYWNIEFENSSRTILIYLYFSNMIFTVYVARKIQVQNRQKIKFVQFDFSNSIFQNPIIKNRFTGKIYFLLG